MKKTYILAFLALGFAFNINAQVELTDDMESYDLGNISEQADHWRTWSGVDNGPDDAEVVDNQANSPSQSLLINDNTLADMVLLTPSQPTTGIYTIEWFSYIPAGRSGYFNMQAALTPEPAPWTQALMGGNVYFNCDGASGGVGGVTGVIDCSIFDFTFTYTENSWFKTTCIYDLDGQTWSMEIDGVVAFTGQPFAFGAQEFEQLAGLDFFSASATNEMYIDDVRMGPGVLGVNDFSETVFSVYPNPVKNVLNISSKASVDTVTVYDILGKVVLTASPAMVSPSIDMSGLSSGTYLVTVKIGNASKTVKVIK